MNTTLSNPVSLTSDEIELIDRALRQQLAELEDAAPQDDKRLSVSSRHHRLAEIANTKIQIRALRERLDRVRGRGAEVTVGFIIVRQNDITVRFDDVVYPSKDAAADMIRDQLYPQDWGILTVQP